MTDSASDGSAVHRVIKREVPDLSENGNGTNIQSFLTLLTSNRAEDGSAQQVLQEVSLKGNLN